MGAVVQSESVSRGDSTSLHRAHAPPSSSLSLLRSRCGRAHPTPLLLQSAGSIHSFLRSFVHSLTCSCNERKGSLAGGGEGRAPDRVPPSRLGRHPAAGRARPATRSRPGPAEPAPPSCPGWWGVGGWCRRTRAGGSPRRVVAGRSVAPGLHPRVAGAPPPRWVGGWLCEGAEVPRQHRYRNGVRFCELAFLADLLSVPIPEFPEALRRVLGRGARSPSSFLLVPVQLTFRHWPPPSPGASAGPGLPGRGWRGGPAPRWSQALGTSWAPHGQTGGCLFVCPGARSQSPAPRRAPGRWWETDRPHRGPALNLVSEAGERRGLTVLRRSPQSSRGYRRPSP